MIKIADKYYYVDIKEFDKFVTSDAESKKNNEPEVKEIKTFNDENILVSRITETLQPLTDKTIDGARYEMIKYLLDLLFQFGPGNEEADEVDEMLNQSILDKSPMQFKLAFNTLKYYKIIKEIEL